jgi:hypothetical protein
MFFVNYNPTTGAIVSYSGGPDRLEHECPGGCEVLAFASDIPGFINTNGALMMKVDVENKVLVFINPVSIPKPISE